jgi:hypothetical protein
VSLGEPPPSSFSLELLHAALPTPSAAMSVSALEANVLMRVSTMNSAAFGQTLGFARDGSENWSWFNSMRIFKDVCQQTALTAKDSITR